MCSSWPPSSTVQDRIRLHLTNCDKFCLFSLSLFTAFESDSQMMPVIYFIYCFISYCYVCILFCYFSVVLRFLFYFDSSVSCLCVPSVLLFFKSVMIFTCLVKFPRLGLLRPRPFGAKRYSCARCRCFCCVFGTFWP